MRTSRRNVTKPGAAAAVASVIPMTAEPEAVTLFEAYVKAHTESVEAMTAHHKAETANPKSPSDMEAVMAESVRAGKAENAALDRLKICQAKTLFGVAIKLIAADIWVGHWEDYGDHTTMVESAIGDARRLTGIDTFQTDA